jgi:hypothetical protein
MLCNRQSLSARNRLAACAVVVTLSSAVVMPAEAADGSSSAAAPAQKAPVKSHDLTGIWRIWHKARDPVRQLSHYDIMLALTLDKPPLTAWGQERYDAARPFVGPRAIPVGQSNDPALKCFPPGIPRLYVTLSTLTEIIQVPGRIFMYFETNNILREIWMDGRKHTEDPDPSWMGESIGRWEGDTLVIDTTGFNDKSWLDQDGLPHSDKLHVIERLRRVDHDNLEIKITIDDPIAYTKPWTTMLMFDRHPEWQIEESICEDNENFNDIQDLLERPASK